MRAGDLLGRLARTADGDVAGRIVDLVTEPDPDGRPRVVAALVTPGWRGRLLGYERDAIAGPWLIERLAGWLHRGTREIPWAEVRLD